MTITREERPNGTNPFKAYIYNISPTYEQNMSSNGTYQLDEFPRQLYIYSIIKCSRNF